MSKSCMNLMKLWDTRQTLLVWKQLNKLGQKSSKYMSTMSRGTVITILMNEVPQSEHFVKNIWISEL